MKAMASECSATSERLMSHSPFSGDPRQNTIWPLYERIAGHSVLDPPLPRITDKPPVPHLALWSRKDGLIAPRAARGLDHASAANLAFSLCRAWRQLALLIPARRVGCDRVGEDGFVGRL